MGKTYKNRQGKLVKIVSYDPRMVYCYIDAFGCTYTPEGIYYLHAFNHQDLVEEIVEKQEPKPEELKLKVGKTYINRRGDIVPIVGYDSDDDFPYIASDGTTYRENGHYLFGDSDKQDLIGEYPSPFEPGINPKDLVGIKKPPMSFIPPSFKAHLAMAFKNGADKYNAYNWRDNKVQAMIYLDAAFRHLDCWLDGEEYAKDSQVHHLAHAAACMGILLDAIETGNLQDNRPPKGKAADVIGRFTTC